MPSTPSHRTPPDARSQNPLARPAARPGASRIWHLGLAVPLLAGGGAIAAARQAWVCDDAFISFCYAENLTHGLGLVYNAGERVEGYTNFLWTLWVALGMKLGATP